MRSAVEPHEVSEQDMTLDGEIEPHPVFEEDMHLDPPNCVWCGRPYLGKGRWQLEEPVLCPTCQRKLLV